MNVPPGVVIKEDPEQDNICRNYKHGAAKILGILQIVLGALILLCQGLIFGIVYGRYFFTYIPRMLLLLTPILAFVAGGFGIYSSRTKSRCSVTATMALSIVAALLSVGVIANEFSAFATISMERSSRYYDDRTSDMNKQRDLKFQVLSGTMGFLGLLEAIVAIVASSFCCPVTCCRGEREDVCHNYKSGAAKILGRLQIVLGSLIFSCHLIIYVLAKFSWFMGSCGIFVPVPIILAGAFGIRSSRTKSNGSVTATMALSIIAAVLCLWIIGESLAYTMLYGLFTERASYIVEEQDGYGMLVLFFIMACLGFVEAIVAIVASAFCCQVRCGQSTPTLVVFPDPMVHYQHPAAGYDQFQDIKHKI